MIKQGYETVTISTDDGRIIAGLLGEDRPDAVVLRDVSQDGKSITIPRSQIEERRSGGASIMPQGLVNNLSSRQQFLDLVRYLMEIAEKGPARARELKANLPPQVRLPLPEAERDIDHAGLIAGLNDKSRKRGRGSTTASASTAMARRTVWAHCQRRCGLRRESSRTGPTHSACTAR